MILKIYGAPGKSIIFSVYIFLSAQMQNNSGFSPASGGREVNLVLRQLLLLLGHPVAKCVGVVGGDDRYLWKFGSSAEC